MKKVAILSLHLGYGGIEKSIVALANMLVEKYDVEIVCTYKLYDKPSFPLDSKVKVNYLIKTDLPKKVSDYKVLLKKLEVRRLSRRLKEDYFSKGKAKEFFKDAIGGLGMYNKRATAMKKYISNSNADIIISTRDIFDEWLGDYGKPGVLKIGWEHNHYHGDMKYANKIVRSARKLDYLVLVSNSLKKFYESKMRHSRCRVVFIPNVIDKIPRNRSKLDQKRLISVGRLSEEKGYIDLLRIFKSIHEKEKTWRLDIIGDGAEKEKLAKYIKNNNLDSSVTLHGFRDKDYIEDMLKESSLFLMTSFTESFGIVLIEAMSYGLPCIAFTSAEGAREIITSGRNGYLIKNRSFEAYERKCLDLMRSLEIRKKIGKAAKESISKYSSSIVKKDWFKLLEK